jgi:outer membrane murein-binding lipoprotein Lpp
MTLKKSAAVAVALLLSLAVVGCGSKKADDASSDAAGQAEKQSQDNGGNSTTTTEEGGSTTTTSGSTSDAINSLNDLTNGNLGDCLSTSLAYAKLVLAPLGFTGGASQDQIDQFEKDTQDLEAKIPPELKDDFDTVAAAYKEYGDTLKGIDITDIGNSDTLNKLEDASQKLDSPDVKAAQDRIQAYFDDNCGK